MGAEPPPDNTMKKILLILSLGAAMLGGCAVYVPDAGVVAAPQGGPGNGFCPPGQAKKGNC
ncbi:putative lipoprotein [Ralstonia solanacearum CMR15]|nr:putative lipoprotein [Ralstonia solanacearum CMR15]